MARASSVLGARRTSGMPPDIDSVAGASADAPGVVAIADRSPGVAPARCVARSGVVPPRAAPSRRRRRGPDGSRASLRRSARRRLRSPCCDARPAAQRACANRADVRRVGGGPAGCRRRRPGRFLRTAGRRRRRRGGARAPLPCWSVAKYPNWTCQSPVGGHGWQVNREVRTMRLLEPTSRTSPPSPQGTRLLRP